MCFAHRFRRHISNSNLIFKKSKPLKQIDEHFAHQPGWQQHAASQIQGGSPAAKNVPSLFAAASAVKIEIDPPARKKALPKARFAPRSAVPKAQALKNKNAPKKTTTKKQKISGKKKSSRKKKASVTAKKRGGKKK